MNKPFATGTVTHPEDLTPAIEALGPVGRDHLLRLAGGRKVEPWMIAKAADYENYGKPENQ
jgi:hypothetical protein